MKITYDFIKENLNIYEEAKKTIPVISQYENNLVGLDAIRQLQLIDFTSLCDFKKQFGKDNVVDFITTKNGMEITEPVQLGTNLIAEKITWKKLKKIIAVNTDTPRFKKYILNRTEKQFQETLLDFDEYDRLSWGRWINKPKQRRGRRGGMTYGKRADECVQGLNRSVIFIINYIIQNDLEVNDKIVNDIFENHSVFQFFKSVKLDLNKVPQREIEITNKMIESLSTILEDTKIDFRKLNIDYITSTLTRKLMPLMKVPNGTSIKCIRESKEYPFKENVYYNVVDSQIDRGGLMVRIDGVVSAYSRNWIPYSYFEDVSLHRDNLLDMLLNG